MLPGTLVLGLVLLAVVSPARPADAWQRRIGSNLRTGGGGVALDSRGDVIGSTERHVGGRRLPEIVKLSGDRGRQQWRRTIDDADRAHVRALLTTADDDVIVALQRGPIGFIVARLAAADGAVIWRRDVPVRPGRDHLMDVKLGSTGDVIIGAGIDERMVVLALHGADGTERWKSVLTPLGEHEIATAVAVAPDGDVIVAGDTTAPGAVIARLDGSTGATRWTRAFPHLRHPVGLAVDGGDGTVVFGARAPFGPPSTWFPTSRFAVVLLDATGEPVWERRLEPANGRASGDGAEATTFLLDGDVVAMGTVDDELVTARLARTTGDVVWRHELDGEGGFLVQTPDGNLLAGVNVFSGRTCWDAALLELSAASGEESGRRRMRGGAANDHSGCSSGVNDDGLRALAVSDLGVAIAAHVGDPRGRRRLIARFPFTRQ